MALIINKVYELLSVEIPLDEGKAKDDKPKNIAYNVRQQKFVVRHGVSVKDVGTNPKEMLVVYNEL